MSPLPVITLSASRRGIDAEDLSEILDVNSFIFACAIETFAVGAIDAAPVAGRAELAPAAKPGGANRAWPRWRCASYAFEPEDQALIEVYCALLEGKTERQKTHWLARPCRLGLCPRRRIVMRGGWLEFAAAKRGISLLAE
jgi:hypothetical protein